jgi:hypothetical protein
MLTVHRSISHTFLTSSFQVNTIRHLLSLIQVSIHPVYKSRSLIVGVVTDKFESISESYALFNEHKIPGGLKVCLATEFGRSLDLSAHSS